MVFYRFEYLASLIDWLKRLCGKQRVRLMNENWNENWNEKLFGQIAIVLNQYEWLNTFLLLFFEFFNYFPNLSHIHFGTVNSWVWWACASIGAKFRVMHFFVLSRIMSVNCDRTRNELMYVCSWKYHWLRVFSTFM